eukprot:CAMPEP_0175915154 /NCGR_PEP_ID=MMETSP0108-20121206/10168_1 /TAXON_ID=195067 ORGANISM="Goniomonas pacifica, Strain CCMP1869" /NCGR_SAMPLE_ID=MMETSP0108 /ASSEMBLY_ACC=CAM_ASM_000204 /LENGTH=291 /DNA_ID=CAMNT_0017237633 /DNA_START=171 /DNA_END=1046 /DNA_ORIENTATION=-
MAHRIVTENDGYTGDLAVIIAEELTLLTGQRPHLVLCHLSRKKLDANRPKDQAALGNPAAEVAWEGYMGFLERARKEVTAGCGGGLYIDLHGQSHTHNRTELGYLLRTSQLGLPSDELQALAPKTSVASLSHRLPLPAILSGPTSLGAFLETNPGDNTIPATPSPSLPVPPAQYYNGGYCTRRFGSRDGGSVDGIQMEVHRSWRFGTDEQRRLAGRSIAQAIAHFVGTHYHVANTCGSWPTLHSDVTVTLNRGGVGVVAVTATLGLVIAVLGAVVLLQRDTAPTTPSVDQT